VVYFFRKEDTMTEQEWIATSTGPGFTLGEICADLDLDIEDLAQDHSVPLLHDDTLTLTHAEKIQEVLYEAYANDALVEVYQTKDSYGLPISGTNDKAVPMFLGMAQAKDVDIFQAPGIFGKGRGHIVEALLESGRQVKGNADNYDILSSGC
jgi:hypothetical protein